MARPYRIVTEWRLRQIFNEAGYQEKLENGELRPRVLEDAHPSSPKADEPFCTRSQIVSYRTAAGKEVARIHRYLRVDGDLGASGFPDPKRVIHDGVIYALDVDWVK